MSDQDTTEDQQPTPEKVDEELRAPGLKALQAERDAREQAEKATKALQDRLDAIEAEKLTDLQKAQKAADDAAAAVQAKDAELAKAVTDVLRWRIAARHGIGDEDAELFLTGNDEETLNRQAERLTERLAASTPLPRGVIVPGAGKVPETPPSLDTQIHTAESDGNTGMALALKAKRLAELAGGN